jgi:hypothetical protein
MNKQFLKRIALMGNLFFSITLFSQLKTFPPELWEKTDPDPRKAVKCPDENLLNFHCGIKDRVLKKYIRYSNHRSHTLSLVHSSKEDELIWKEENKNISLNNDKYSKGKRITELGKRPSIFSYTELADTQNEKQDSLGIRFEDQNLYELIFYPKKVTAKDLNKIHSYLSIKYGISLEKGIYYSSEGAELWDPKKHKEYPYRPTGLGRDNGNDLYQKQSCNQADLFLTIGFNTITRTNSENPAVIDNNHFVMWSDDNKEMTLKREKEMDVLERSWEINFLGKDIPKTNYSVRIKKEMVNSESLSLSYWLLLKKNNGEIKKIAGRESEHDVTFDKVEFMDAFDSGDVTHFTFAVSPVKNIESQNGSTIGSGSQYGLEDISVDSGQILLYPNPVKKGQNFTLTFPSMEDLSISIYDGGGRLVKLEKISHTAKSYMGSLPMQSAYLISLTHHGKIIKTFKLTVD